jgi:hypothetical protein
VRSGGVAGAARGVEERARAALQRAAELERLREGLWSGGGADSAGLSSLKRARPLLRHARSRAASRAAAVSRLVVREEPPPRPLILTDARADVRGGRCGRRVGGWHGARVAATGEEEEEKVDDEEQGEQ